MHCSCNKTDFNCMKSLDLKKKIKLSVVLNGDFGWIRLKKYNLYVLRNKKKAKTVGNNLHQKSSTEELSLGRGFLGVLPTKMSVQASLRLAVNTVS